MFQECSGSSMELQGHSRVFRRVSGVFQGISTDIRGVPEDFIRSQALHGLSGTLQRVPAGFVLLHSSVEAASLFLWPVYPISNLFTSLLSQYVLKQRALNVQRDWKSLVLDRIQWKRIFLSA